MNEPAVTSCPVEVAVNLIGGNGTLTRQLRDWGLRYQGLER